MWLELLVLLACSDGEGNDSPADTEEADADTDTDTDADTDADTDSDADTDVVPPGNAAWVVGTAAGDLGVELQATDGHWLSCERSTEGKDRLDVVLANTPQTANATALVSMSLCPYGTGGTYAPPLDPSCKESGLNFTWKGEDGSWQVDSAADDLACSVTLSDDGTDYTGTFSCTPLVQTFGGDDTVNVREGSFTCRMQ